MAKIGYLIACQGIESGPSKETIIINPYAAINPISIPGNYSFTLAFSLFALDPKEEYDMKITLEDPEKNKILNQEFKFQFDAPPDSSTKRPYGEMSINFPNYAFQIPGEYTFQISIGNESSKSLSIEVYPKSDV